MIRKTYWSYADLLNLFNSKPAKRQKFFEYLLYSINEPSEEENIILRNTFEFIEAPYEMYLECLKNSLKKSYLSLPNYLNKPLDIDDYNQIKSRISEIELLQKSRKEIIRQAKAEAEQLLKDSNAQIERTIKGIKEAQAEREKTRNIRQELDDFKQTLKDLESTHESDKIARKMQQIQEPHLTIHR